MYSLHKKKDLSLNLFYTDRFKTTPAVLTVLANLLKDNWKTPSLSAESCTEHNRPLSTSSPSWRNQIGISQSDSKISSTTWFHRKHYICVIAQRSYWVSLWPNANDIYVKIQTLKTKAQFTWATLIVFWVAPGTQQQPQFKNEIWVSETPVSQLTFVENSLSCCQTKNQ